MHATTLSIRPERGEGRTILSNAEGQGADGAWPLSILLQETAQQKAGRSFIFCRYPCVSLPAAGRQGLIRVNPVRNRIFNGVNP